LILASAGADGWLCLWDENREVSQIFTDSEAGFSTLSWHPQGQLLAAGGEQGELIIHHSDRPDANQKGRG
jgi:hypothetical protein